MSGDLVFLNQESTHTYWLSREQKYVCPCSLRSAQRNLILKSGTKEKNLIFKKVKVGLCDIFTVRKRFLCLGQDSAPQKNDSELRGSKNLHGTERRCPAVASVVAVVSSCSTVNLKQYQLSLFRYLYLVLLCVSESPWVDS